MTKKNKNKLKTCLILVFISIIGYLAYIYISTPTRIIPYPFKINNDLTTKEEYIQASKADILIIGDRMGNLLAHYKSRLVQKISTKLNLQTNLRVFNWARDNEGIHRTLYKLKNLKSLPKYIIYHGAGQEFSEKLFNIQDAKNIITDFDRFKNPHISTLITLFPVLSRFLYKNKNILEISKYTGDKTPYNDRGKQAQIEITYRMYKHQIKELVKLVKRSGSNIFLITIPINLDIPPGKVCNNTTTDKIENYLDEMKQYLDDGKSKQVYTNLNDLRINTVSNSRTYYLFGQAASKLGRYSEAREALKKAIAYDCRTTRATPVFNSIMINCADINNVPLIDFNDLVNRNFGRKDENGNNHVLFLDNLRPQDKYYETVISILAATIIKLLYL